MIFVTVGNALQSFKRLVESADRLGINGPCVGEPIIIQSGNTRDAHVSAATLEAFVDMDRFERLINDSDILICHAGNGTLMHALRVGKVPIVMPRLARYCEHIDDHQLDLVRILAEEGRIIPAFEAHELEAAVGEARRRRSQDIRMPTPPLVEMIAQALQDISEKSEL